MAKPSTDKVGEMFAPASYGHIHFFKKLDLQDDIRKKINRDLTMANASLWAQEAPPDIRQKFEKMVRAVDGKLDRLEVKAQRVKALTKIEYNMRKKRAVVALAAAAVVAGIIISIGLGVVNTDQINDLTRRVERMETDAEELLVSVKAIEAQVNNGLEEANRSIVWSEWDRFLEREARRIRMEIAEVEERTDEYERGFFHAMQGTLDPAFVSLPDLNRGLAKMKAQARRYGMAVAPFETPIEVFFTMPVSVVLNGSGVHLFLSVPMVPVKVPVFELVRISHPPIHLAQDRFLELSTDDIYLAIDHEKKMHAEVSPAMLATCDRHKTTWMCTRLNTFSTTPDTCAAGLMFGDKELVKRLCHQVVRRRQLVVMPADGFDVEVWSMSQQTVVKVCPNVKDTPLQRFQGRRHVSMAAGCYLRTQASATYLTHSVPQQEVECVRTNWTKDDFIETHNMRDLLHHLELTDHAVDLRHLQLVPHEWVTNNTLTMMVVSTMTIVLISIGALMWRCASVVRRRRTMRKKEREKDDA